MQRIIVSCVAALAAFAAAAFQIDNSDKAAVARYVASGDGAIKILPALDPGEFSGGHVEGVQAEGGFVFDIEWNRGRMSIMRVLSKDGGKCRLEIANDIRSSAIRRIGEGLYEFDTEKDKIYEFRNGGAVVNVIDAKNSFAIKAKPVKTQGRRIAQRGQKPVVLKVGGKNADFATLQSAIDSIPSSSGKPYEIRLAPGRYREKIEIRNKPPVKIVAVDPDPAKTVISWNDTPKTLGPDGRELGTGGSRTLYAGSDDFEMVGITIENTGTPERLAATGGKEQAGQCVALYTVGDRAVFRKCRILGWQDTLYADGHSGDSPARQYFEDCYIEGAVDFIFGGSIALFNRCKLHSVNGGYIAAGRHDSDVPFGYVFYKCKITAAPGKTTYLGRPWRPFANVAFIGCDYTDAVRPEGWRDWSTACGVRVWRSAEYACTEGLKKVVSRPDAIVQVGTEKDLKARLAAAGMKSILDILAAPDDWRPAK